AGDGAGCSERRSLIRRHVCCMDQAPAITDVVMVEQPLHWALAGPRQAVLDLLDLLGRVNVEWTAVCQQKQLAQLTHRDRAQAVRCDAEIGAGKRTDGLAR